MTRVDIVVPVRNEARNIPRFLATLRALELPAEVEWRVIFVEDGSRDDTVAALRDHASRDSHVVYYAMANGFGEGPAAVYGLSRSDADAVIMMAVDGSHPVHVVPQMIRDFRDGAEVVQCVRTSFSGRAWYRDAGSALFHLTVRALTGYRFERQNVYFRLMSRSYVRQILTRPRYWRYVRFPLPSERSGALRTIPVEMAERSEGTSTYGPARLANLALDGLLSFISWQRLTVVLTGCLVALGLLWRQGWRALPVLAMVGASYLVYRFLRLLRANYLEELVVAESGGTLRRPKARDDDPSRCSQSGG